MKENSGCSECSKAVKEDEGVVKVGEVRIARWWDKEWGIKCS